MGITLSRPHDHLVCCIRSVLRSIAKLLSRRKGHTRQPKYSAPTGFWAFDYCTCPNYLGELLEWAGFALMTWPSPASLCFLWMTFCNLYPRARDRHRRYCEQLPGYQALGRTAVIPFLL